MKTNRHFLQTRTFPIGSNYQVVIKFMLSPNIRQLYKNRFNSQLASNGKIQNILPFTENIPPVLAFIVSTMFLSLSITLIEQNAITSTNKTCSGAWGKVEKVRMMVRSLGGDKEISMFSFIASDPG